MNRQGTKVKLCGMFRDADIDAVNEVLPDYCGFIIDFPKSHRSLPPARVRQLRQRLSENVLPVGVFVDAPEETILRLLSEDTIRIAQLHGNESDDTIRRIQTDTKRPVIRAFIIRSKEDVRRALHSPADYLLFDCGRGEGRTFDWSLLEDVRRPFFLAGGLNENNLQTAVNTLHPFAVDVSSGIETDRVKDPAKMHRVMDIIQRSSSADR